MSEEAKQNSTIAAMYIGYDPMGKQFKVLCMTSSRVRDNTHRVLTLGPGKRFWRRVKCKFHFVESFVINRDICINGVLYFGARVRGVSKIVCFNVGSEKFSFIKTNKDMRNSRYMNSLTLFNYKGRLAIYRRVDSYQKSLMFWVIEDAENHKWSNHIYELTALENDMITFTHAMFVGVTGTGEFVWSSLSQGPPKSLYLNFYNFGSRTLTKVNIQGFEEFTHRYIYIETYLDYVENVKWLM